jgi:hypothetical protein
MEKSTQLEENCGDEGEKPIGNCPSLEAKKVPPPLSAGSFLL